MSGMGIKDGRLVLLGAHDGDAMDSVQAGEIAAMARELYGRRRASQAAPAPSDGLREALEWYADTVRKCRMIHSEGDEARAALDADGGRRALTALEIKDQNYG